MRKILLLTIFLFNLLLDINVFGQLLIEDFNFTGNLTDNGYTAHSVGGTNPLATTTGLTYSGYLGSDIGNAVLIGNAGGEDVNKGFTEVNTDGAVIYYSLLVNVTDAASSKSGDYFFHIGNRSSLTSFTQFAARIFARISSDNINFGISNTSTATYGTTNFSKNITYLLIVKYTINTSGVDDVSLWVFSSGVPSTEIGAGIAEVTNSLDGEDVIDAFGIRQGSSTTQPQIVLDGIRIATSWSQAPLPVELSSFSAFVNGSAVNLKWHTKTEVNNYGFEILRSTQNDNDSWTKIGFVNGHGNSNSPKDYSFTDRSILSGKFIYRLKQIDTDGKYEYSKEVEVDLGLPKNYSLEQNYPNPFNPSTVISWQSPVGSQQVIKLFDVIGNEVATLINEWKEAGSHSLKFDASDLSSGVYYYKLTTDNFSSTKKMILTK
ncbi:MAG: hypothetical protein A2315_02395 [Ignavibacteria bacterium RIFOXYB2_FULL_35_12]|nr:MAG: hypothetical protein A2058_14480 [Ignavibacteria bacterium GWA2_36_19]OGU59091.1 MAG: hypothetical protein A2X60_05345 [Ignavibacteria bacterium GWF2_35_20]OGU79342.1 MAG: hypothetical protein A2254_09380 [Ignavibacteria bacterium RIFOXYA2_FULL_35_9]OGU88643.1 MAG: hypothetical protein A3K31_06575 [Ignavibacteria bacterium RIFOXYA12_FULL_35_25]OGU89921.1 MAG: hypothetical protein A2492_14255 [Ignavibacteria bacterium RIFOXYC12_FULL_35_11]OGU96462.1 MAG: hypothetical protein A2347_10755